MALRLDSGASDFDAAFGALVSNRRGALDAAAASVEPILADVAARGDAALIDYSAKFDQVTLTAETLRIAPDEIEAAAQRAPAEAVAALQFAAERIIAYHEPQRPADGMARDTAGVELGVRWTALATVGIYVPGGKAAYPSTVLMNALPARVAGVERIVMAAPAPRGEINPLVLAAARIAGIEEVYRIGGAQAIAALAHGTATIAAVDKIVGPGNVYVAAAKRRLFGQVGIDLIAGPSEILVVADGDSDPAWIAADLLSQAEHDEAAQAVLITDDAGLAERVATEVERLLAELPRADIARASWERHGAIIRVARLAEAPALIDRIAPEHLELAVDDPEALAAQVRHAGAIFLGRYTPEAIGDYVAGPNHVLPTGGNARFASGLSVLDFIKRTSLVRCDSRAIAAVGPAAMTLAGAEGLPAHARAVALRLAASD